MSKIGRGVRDALANYGAFYRSRMLGGHPDQDLALENARRVTALRCLGATPEQIEHTRKAAARAKSGR